MSEINTPAAPQPLPLPKGSVGRKPRDLKLWKAATDFHGIFLGQFVRAMRTSAIKSDLLEEAAGREVFDEMFSEAIAKKMAESGSFGLQRVIYRELGGRFETAGAPDKRVENNNAP